MISIIANFSNSYNNLLKYQHLFNNKNPNDIVDKIDYFIMEDIINMHPNKNVNCLIILKNKDCLPCIPAIVNNKVTHISVVDSIADKQYSYFDDNILYLIDNMDPLNLKEYDVIRTHAFNKNNVFKYQSNNGYDLIYFNPPNELNNALTSFYFFLSFVNEGAYILIDQYLENKIFIDELYKLLNFDQFVIVEEVNKKLNLNILLLKKQSNKIN